MAELRLPVAEGQEWTAVEGPRAGISEECLLLRCQVCVEQICIRREAMLLLWMRLRVAMWPERFEGV